MDAVSPATAALQKLDPDPQKTARLDIVKSVYSYRFPVSYLKMWRCFSAGAENNLTMLPPVDRFYDPRQESSRFLGKGSTEAQKRYHPYPRNSF